MNTGWHGRLQRHRWKQPWHVLCLGPSASLWIGASWVAFSWQVGWIRCMHFFNIFKTIVEWIVSFSQTCQVASVDQNGLVTFQFRIYAACFFPRRCMAICFMPGIHTSFDKTEPKFGHILGYCTMRSRIHTLRVQCRAVIRVHNFLISA